VSGSLFYPKAEVAFSCRTLKGDWLKVVVVRVVGSESGRRRYLESLTCLCFFVNAVRVEEEEITTTTATNWV
jgi:hypothetical protein